MHRNSHTLALGRFGAFALVGVILISMFAAGVKASGSGDGTPSSASSDYVNYVITEKSEVKNLGDIDSV